MDKIRSGARSVTLFSGGWVLLKKKTLLKFVHFVRVSREEILLSTSCLDVVKEEKPRPRQRPDLSGLDFSSQSAEFTDSFAKDITLTELAPVLPCT